MARPQMDSRVDGQNTTAPQSCRMEVLRRDGRPSVNSQLHRRRTTATQPSPAPQPVSPSQDTLNVPTAHQQEDPDTENTGTEQEQPSPAGTQQPQPDLLPESHSSSGDSSSRDSPGEEEPMPEEQAVHRVAIQLRTIGDEMNAVYLQRMNEAPQWQNWRGLYRGLVAFLADTISTLYQHRLR